MSKVFTFINNGPYNNRGCEAIIRGTLELFHDFDAVYSNIAFFRSAYEMICQNKSEHERIKHYQANGKSTTLLQKFLKKMGIKRRHFFNEKVIQPLINASDACFSLGGDNYSLDYGYPNQILCLDRFVLQQNKPLLIWAASIGPFTKDLDFEKKMTFHLKNTSTIFIREEKTLNYLESLGLGNKLFLMADPAFLMKSRKPTFKKVPVIESGSIGVNLSPIISKHIDSKNPNVYMNLASKFLSMLQHKTDRKIYLIPHVSKKGNSDFLFMRKILLNLEKRDNIVLIDDIYNAEETKWIISKLHVFCGARTHSTIASLSTCVPTLSLSYSMKAIGINMLLFKTLDYCIPVSNFNPEMIISVLVDMLNNRDSISDQIRFSLFRVNNLLQNSKEEVIKKFY